MKYTVDTTNKSIELQVSSPVELRDLVADLESIEEKYEGYTVTITAPPVFVPNVQPYEQPWNPSQPFGPGIVYCSNGIANGPIAQGNMFGESNTTKDD